MVMAIFYLNALILSSNYFIVSVAFTVDQRFFISTKLPQIKTSETFDEYNSNDDMNIKMAIAKHTLLSVAASIMNVPAEVLTTPPMIDPYAPSSPEEFRQREVVSSVLSRGWNRIEGYEIPTEEVSFVNNQRNPEESGYPSTYGEITELGCRQLFKYMRLLDEANVSGDKTNMSPVAFGDLGCGNGKLLVQAYMEVPNLERLIGVEMSSTRYNIAVGAWDKLKKEAQEIRKEKSYPDLQIEFYEGDLFDLDVSNLTHIYCASLCFTNEMMTRLSRKLCQEANRLQCVATLKPLSHDIIDFFDGEPQEKHLEMSWTKSRGMGCTVYFYHR